MINSIKFLNCVDLTINIYVEHIYYEKDMPVIDLSHFIKLKSLKSIELGYAPILPIHYKSMNVCNINYRTHYEN